jgi:rubrerythrin
MPYNPEEVFEIAEQIERNGARFYRKAAAIFTDPDLSKLFLKLADWEAEHEKTFTGMKKMFRSNTASISFRPEETLPDPKVMAGLAIFGIRAEPTEELNGKESRDDILRGALEKEKDSIVFYNGLKDFLSDAADRTPIDRIITEERQHIKTLQELLNQNIENKERKK